MKKWLIGLVIICFFAVVTVYIFIPRKITVSNSILINCSHGGAERFLSTEANWKKWWPSKAPANNDNNFIYRDRSFRIEQKLYNGVQVVLQDNDTKLTSRIHVVSLPNSSAAIEWVCEIDSSFNPIKKIFDYQLGKKIQSDFTDILQSAKLFLEKQENVYGFSIRQISTTDTLLISTKSIFAGKPSTADIYHLIGALKKYISQEGGIQTNHPLLNVTGLDSGRFQAMVAIPVNKRVKGNVEIQPKRMVPGRFLVSEIKGGESTIDNAMKQMNLYTEDYSRSLVALPFQVMVTDRQAESDTSKWITQIYYPVF